MRRGRLERRNCLALFFVVYGGAGDLFAGRVVPLQGYGAGFAVGGDDDAACGEDRAVFLYGKGEGVVVGLSVGAGVSAGVVAREGVVFAVELAGPLGVAGLPSMPVPSVVILMVSPWASYTTVVFLGAPAEILDFASLSFQVPIWGDWASAVAAPAKQSARVRARAFVVMVVSFGELRGGRAHVRCNRELYTRGPHPWPGTGVRGLVGRRRLPTPQRPVYGNTTTSPFMPKLSWKAHIYGKVPG